MLKMYRFTAILFVNFLLLVLFLNLALFIIFSIKDYFADDPVTARYGQSAVRQLYPGMSGSDVESLLLETWSRPYVYEPFTQFKERPFNGFYVNVDLNGFRQVKNQGSWPPSPEMTNIFVFGGSTMFGYGVPDENTVPSYLQEILQNEFYKNVNVYNFGRGHYFSTQERILYEQLISANIVPDIAIFVDGLNDFFYNNNEPLYTERLRDFMSEDEGLRSHELVLAYLSRTSLARFSRYVAAHFISLEAHETVDVSGANNFSLKGEDPYINEYLLREVLERYRINKRIIEYISQGFGVQTIFVWQPIPNYKYDLKYHLFSKGGFFHHQYAPYGYARMEKIYHHGEMSDNFLWLADIQQDKTVPLYVDRVHYSPGFSEYIARHVAEFIVGRL